MNGVLIFLILGVLCFELNCSSWKVVRPEEAQNLESKRPPIKVLLKDGSTFTAREYDIFPDTLVTYGLNRLKPENRRAIAFNKIDTFEIKQEMSNMPLALSVAGLVTFFTAMSVSQNGNTN